MNLIIDANIIFAALIKQGETYDLIFENKFSLFTPEFFFKELEHHKEDILKKTGNSDERFNKLLAVLQKRIVPVPLEEILPFLKKAESMCPDPDDVSYIALALKLGCPIWSNDKALKDEQKTIVVYSTEDILRFF